jgi:hypothetical protein
MSGPTKSRQKHKLEPISIEELAGTTGMSGFCSFLTRDATVSVPVLDHLVETGAPDLSATLPETAEPETAGLSREAPPPVASPVAAEESAIEPAPVFGPTGMPVLPDYRLPRRIRVREAATVEEGHSLGEQAVYEALWEVARPAPQGDNRMLTIGLRTLAEISRMAYSNCKANVRALIAKRAIDESPEFSYTDGRTYVIYPPEEVMRRRRAAGMTHVIRNRGVIFVDPATGTPLAGAGDSG